MTEILTDCKQQTEEDMEKRAEEWSPPHSKRAIRIAKHLFQMLSEDKPEEAEEKEMGEWITFGVTKRYPRREKIFEPSDTLNGETH